MWLKVVATQKTTHMTWIWVATPTTNTSEPVVSLRWAPMATGGPLDSDGEQDGWFCWWKASDTGRNHVSEAHLKGYVMVRMWVNSRLRNR